MSLSMEIAEDDGLAQFHQWLAILPENASELTLAAGRLTGQERRFICTELQLQLLAWCCLKGRDSIGSQISGHGFNVPIKRLTSLWTQCTAATSATRNKALRQRASNASNRYRQG
jgi:hypothetical protein